MRKAKRILTACLAFAMVVTALVGTEIPVQAASTRKCYTISSSNTTAYTSSSLSTKKGTIYPTDQLTVKTVTSKYCIVSYPIKNGTKTGYIPTSAILKSTGLGTYTCSKKVTTYKRPGGSTYGSISAGDKVKYLGTQNGYTQVKYPVSSGYKYAWIKGSIPTSSNSSSSASTALSYGLYHKSSAYISCGFNGYTNTKGKHEGIDIQGGNGSSIYALTSGTVVRVAKGYRGSNGLSTIAIYDSSANKTVVYLHCAPASLSVGQSISKGQRLGTQDWRGVSSSSGGHTHVEVVNGRTGYAKKSVNDYVLENSNPTSYWASKGYYIK